MSIKRTRFIIFTWLASIVLGMFYNHAILDIESKLPSYIATISMLITFGIAIYATLKIMGINLIKSRLNMLTFCLCAASVLGGIFSLGHFHYMADTILDGLIIAMLFPLGLLCIKNSFNNKFGILSCSLLYFAILAAAGVVSDTKLMLFSGGFILLGEIIAIRLYKPENKKLWYTHVAILASLFIGVALFVLSATTNVHTRTIGYLNPQSVFEYDKLKEWISYASLLEYSPNNSFISDIHSAYAATYAHLLVCFGWIPCLLIMITQITATVFMFINSLRFRDKNKKFLGIMSALMIGCHLYFSIGSSFIRTPMTEFGAPFITTYGLGYCVLPVMLYIWLEYSERGLTLKDIGEFLKILFCSVLDEDPDWYIGDEFNEINELESNERSFYMSNKLFIISGPSGVGKNTIFNEVQKMVPYINKTISDTTRDIRDNEEDGRDYNFISKSEFEGNINRGHYVEYNTYDDNYYGTSFEEVRRTRTEPATAMIIDVNGAKNIKAHYPDAITIFIAPPSVDELIRRIAERNANTPGEIENRIKTAERELEEAWGFDYIITNGNLETSVSELASIVKRHCQSSHTENDRIGKIIKPGIYEVGENIDAGTYLFVGKDNQAYLRGYKLLNYYEDFTFDISSDQTECEIRLANRDIIEVHGDVMVKKVT